MQAHAGADGQGGGDGAVQGAMVRQRTPTATHTIDQVPIVIQDSAGCPEGPGPAMSL